MLIQLHIFFFRVGFHKGNQLETSVTLAQVLYVKCELVCSSSFMSTFHDYGPSSQYTSSSMLNVVKLKKFMQLMVVLALPII